MTRWLPFPLLSFAMFGMWLLLNQSLSPGHLMLGTVLAVAGGLALTPLDLPPLRVRRPRMILELAGIVLVDIVRSNVAVGRIILGPRRAEETSGFMTIPLAMRSPYGLACLAVIMTATPGTLWVKFDPDDGHLTIHVLDLVDEGTWIETIKHRYERRLMEIFE